MIDTSVFTGHWPFRRLEPNTPAGLAEHLRARGVTQAWCSPVEAVLYPDPMLANEPFLAAVTSDPFFVPIPFLDPTLPGWAKDAARCFASGARGLKLTPNYHGYSLNDPVADELAALAMEHGRPLAVQLRLTDERAHHPLMKVPGVPAAEVAAFAGRHPELKVLACGAYFGELAALAKAENVWAELSFVESSFTLSAALKRLRPDRLVFGSHSPFFYFEAAAIKLDADPAMVAAERVRAVATENAAVLLGGQV